MWKLLLNSTANAINYNSLSLWSTTKVFLTIHAAADPCNVLNYEQPPHQIENII